MFETPELISELSGYSWSRQSPEIEDGSRSKPAKSIQAASSERQASVLFLQILTAADYYTMDKALMKHVPPVYVDIILDPFVLNVLPRSLLPTVGYIVVVSIMSWFVARSIGTWIRVIAAEPSSEKKMQ